MRWRLATFVVAATLSFANGAAGQQGGAQGPRISATDQGIQQINQRISQYLNGEETRNILTPGEFSEWPLKLKAGQVVIAEANSESFDPAIEIVDDKQKSLANNDDRYPGDQRPLLLWRCPQDGDYALRVRCFHNKSGGQFFVRYKTYDSVDLPGSGMVEKDISTKEPFLLRVPMKAGQIKDVVSEQGGDRDLVSFRFSQVIFPNGLPERSPSLSEPLSPAIRALVAPLDGDYYLFEIPNYHNDGHGTVRVGVRDIVPKPLTKEGVALSGKAPTNYPVLWELPVKAGDLLQVSAPDLNVDTKLMIAERPDFSKFDATKPETNPFFPQAKNVGVHLDAAVSSFAARARDGRIAIFQALRDTTLWIASDAAGQANKEFVVNVKPAAAEFVEGKANVGKLRIGNTDYWAIDGKVGDVMSLTATASDFAQQIVVRDPDLSEIRGTTAGPDQTSDTWRMIVQRPGRYLVAISCLGDGGSGPYTLSRKVFHATEFSRATPAKGEISDGEVQIWKFTAKPNEPLLIRWDSTAWTYDVAVYDDKGQETGFQKDPIDANSHFGILKVDAPKTFIIVLTGNGAKANYSIQLNPLPGYKPK